MSQKRTFIAVNSTLAVIGLLCLYYLLTSAYAAPHELEEANRWIEIIKKPNLTTGSKDGQTGPTVFAHLEKPNNVMRALYTMPATSTPTPRPSPTPVPLTVVITSWQIIGMDETIVNVMDQKDGSEFEMTLNQTKKGVEFQGTMYEVTLCGIDLESDSPKATFCALGMTAEKVM